MLNLKASQTALRLRPSPRSRPQPPVQVLEHAKGASDPDLLGQYWVYHPWKRHEPDSGGGILGHLLAFPSLFLIGPLQEIDEAVHPVGPGPLHQKALEVEPRKAWHLAHQDLLGRVLAVAHRAQHRHGQPPWSAMAVCSSAPQSPSTALRADCSSSPPAPGCAISAPRAGYFATGGSRVSGTAGPRVPVIRIRTTRPRRSTTGASLAGPALAAHKLRFICLACVRRIEVPVSPSTRSSPQRVPA